MSRRELLQVGAASMLGLSLPQLLQADATRKVSARADSCIIIFLNGGPSHLDMWDLKPDAPAEIRGEFKPIASSIPGYPISEHLPKLARRLNECTLVRSMHHSVNNSHAAGVYTAMTGHDRGEATTLLGAGANDHPAVGSVLAKVNPPTNPVVPYVSLPFITKEGAGGPPQPGFFAGWLGRAYDPFFILRDPNAADFGMPELTLRNEISMARLDERRGLVDQLGSPKLQGRQFTDMNGFQSRAFDLLTSPDTQRALQIDRESARTRDAYGRNIYGQSVLLARRLIEAGTRLACISWAPDANATWDTHGNNFKSLKEKLLPQLDAAVSTLLDDLHERGRLERTVVAVMGEFGRTPKVNPNAGRDHWNFCYSLMLAGGGFKRGHIYGASDRIGGQPSLNPLRPADIIATIYDALGMSNEMELRDRLDRPFQLAPWGSSVSDLLA